MKTKVLFTDHFVGHCLDYSDLNPVPLFPIYPKIRTEERDVCKLLAGVGKEVITVKLVSALKVSGNPTVRWL